MSADGVLARLRSVCATWPDRAGWRFARLQALWCFPLIGLAGWWGGFLAWRPELGAGAWRLVAIALSFPALVEESLFRVAFVPRRGGHDVWRALLALSLFVAWHPLQSRLYWVPWRDLVSDPWFLAAVALLGLACTRIWL